MRKAGKHLVALHIVDAEGEKDQHLMPYGRGTVPWEKFMQAIRKIGYRGLFNLEIPGEKCCLLPIRLFKLDYLRFYMAYMLTDV